MNPLKALSEYGQSVWLDYIRRNLIATGELKRLVEEDGLAGVTSNPAIFEKAITGSTDYTEDLVALQEQDFDPASVFERLAVRDIQDAADVLRPLFNRTNRRDGFVSLEVSPFKANETEATIEEARRLWSAVGRENLMIKVPATPAGLPAIETLIGEGINVNITLLFAREAYERVAEAYLRGLESLSAKGEDPSRVASVASFFVSRIDAAVEAIVKARLKSAADPAGRELLKSLPGKVAIANAKLAYRQYKSIFSGDRWRALADRGARTQRLLWASTSAKNPSYRDVIYVEELIGPDTVNTIPPATLDAFRDHGRPRASLEEDVDAAQDAMDRLEAAGISMKDVTDKLLEDGVRLFAEAFDKLLAAVNKRCRMVVDAQINRQHHTLSEADASRVRATLEDWKLTGKVLRLWTWDATLWTDSDEGNWLGWLGVTEDQLAHGQHLRDLADEMKADGFSHVVLLGMGGSSLCPEVFRKTFGRIEGFPELHVLDSTDPAQVKTLEDRIDPADTLFIVSSKSGSTLEPNIFKQYFFERVREAIGVDRAGDRFIAVTDPGSNLERIAEEDGFRHIFHGDPSIGGRYSALSNFGMVPAAAMGLDALKLLDSADEMAVSSSSCLPADDNPGVVLGAALGVLAQGGRDKVTLIASPGIRALGAWLEQLIAESTGKDGRGLIPVDREPLGPPDVYGDDRVFVYERLESAPDASQDAAVSALEEAGHPVLRFSVAEPHDLGQEFFRWEIATAVAGSILGINPFDQPDVEAGKAATRELMAEYEKTSALPPETPIFKEKGVQLFADEQNAISLWTAVTSHPSLAGYLGAHLDRIEAGDYFALLAYIEMKDTHEEPLQRMRRAVRDHRRAATCLGFGPRFLHSTGQAYKGGPNTGVFLQITCDDARDLPVPGQRFTFGAVKAAQAQGDFQVLAERNRRALRVHLGEDVAAGLEILQTAILQTTG